MQYQPTLTMRFGNHMNLSSYEHLSKLTFVNFDDVDVVAAKVEDQI
jgi:hypothetical protein